MTSGGRSQETPRRPSLARGTTPTLPLLERLAAALGLTLTVSLTPAESCTA
jgi:hypothetical protein